MTDAGLFVAIAEIAGVFVGFGALISVTRRRDIEAEALGAIRAVVTTGLTVVIAALIPVALDAYGLGERTTWFVASLAFLVLSWAIIALSLRAPATRESSVGGSARSPGQASSTGSPSRHRSRCP